MRVSETKNIYILQLYDVGSVINLGVFDNEEDLKEQIQYLKEVRDDLVRYLSVSVLIINQKSSVEKYTVKSSYNKRAGRPPEPLDTPDIPDWVFDFEATGVMPEEGQ